MRTLWVSGLVLALGWLSVTSGDSDTDMGAGPPPARAGAPAEEKATILDGVVLGKPIAISRESARSAPQTIALNLPPAPVEAGTRVASRSVIVARGQSADDPPPAPPTKVVEPQPDSDIYIEGGSTSEPETPFPSRKKASDEIKTASQPLPTTLSPKASSNAKGTDPGVEESSPDGVPESPRVMASEKPDAEDEEPSEFAAERSTAPFGSARGQAPSESDGAFGVDRPSAKPKEVKQRDKPAARPDRTTGKPTEEHPGAAKGIIARAKEILHPSAKEKEKKSPAAKTPEKKPTSDAMTAEKKDTAAPPAPSKKIDTKIEPVGGVVREEDPPSEDKGEAKPSVEGPALLKDETKEKTATERSEEKPEAEPNPRMVPQPAHDSSAVLGKPTVCCAEESCPYPGRAYGSAEYLVWWTKADHAPPLVTTGPASSNGILGQPGTQVLFGGQLNGDVRQGGRFTVGYWLDDCHECAVEATYFFLGDARQRFGANSNQFPLLARPFFRENTGSEFSEIVTRSDLSNGSVRVDAPTQLWGAELNARTPLCCACTYRIDGIYGFRYLDLKEGLHITEDVITTANQTVFPNSHVVVSDRFDTRNQFYGGQIGLDGEIYRGRFSFGMRAKVALGDNHETLDINGSQVITDAQGNLHVFRGGLLALQSNIGHFTRDRFSVVPELGLTIGCQLTDQLRATIGYNVLYWSNVIRPGEQIDRVIDETLIPNFGARHPSAGQNRPMVLFKQSDFWAQGLTFGMEYKY
jgi:hypothetical protein